MAQAPSVLLTRGYLSVFQQLFFGELTGLHLPDVGGVSVDHAGDHLDAHIKVQGQGCAKKYAETTPRLRRVQSAWG